MAIKLESENLCIEPFTNDDVCRIKELANDKELANILGLPHPYKLEFAQDWVDMQPELMRQGIEYPLGIISKESREIVGTITLRIDKGNNRGELGYWIGKNYWGKGFATEAVNRMIHFGFIELGLNKIWASAISRNRSSIKVLEKSGLCKEGTLRQNRLLLNTYEDVDVYGILKTEYTFLNHR
ncbi:MULTISPECIES: GNAT family N-acetyltransferase [Bacillus]|uniref:Acetyltransferase GNAT family n=2 Tax=Bacillus cereus group TaxID=86661 RepID=A0A164Q7K9_BACCE|nr:MULTISPECIES: GNAT family N-acetyltransferase [Bacillus]KZD70106.1 Acetyltransferase GNAT family [Bacillus cereus]PEW66471.1 N-acetyltransferase [Bacillus cereus]TSI12568.1 GNAT family N-acetyltransferase [Bacillus sp. HY001]SME37485.1 Putative ribosomal N-acetyltransferase YdaF [Bacillus mobilis]